MGSRTTRSASAVGDSRLGGRVDVVNGVTVRRRRVRRSRSGRRGGRSDRVRSRGARRRRLGRDEAPVLRAEPVGRNRLAVRASRTTRCRRRRGLRLRLGVRTAVQAGAALRGRLLDDIVGVGDLARSGDLATLLRDEDPGDLAELPVVEHPSRLLLATHEGGVVRPDDRNLGVLHGDPVVHVLHLGHSRLVVPLDLRLHVSDDGLRLGGTGRELLAQLSLIGDRLGGEGATTVGGRARQRRIDLADDVLVGGEALVDLNHLRRHHTTVRHRDLDGRRSGDRVDDGVDGAAEHEERSSDDGEPASEEEEQLLPGGVHQVCPYLPPLRGRVVETRPRQVGRGQVLALD